MYYHSLCQELNEHYPITTQFIKPSDGYKSTNGKDPISTTLPMEMNEVLPHRMIILHSADMNDVHEVERFDDDDVLADVLNNLRNAPCNEKLEARPTKKRRVQKARPKRLPEISVEFTVNPPHRYVIMANGDPRVSIGHIFMEAYSTGSAQIFTDMMNERCDPNIIFMQHYDGKQNPYGPNDRKIVGLRNVTDFWLTCMSSAPDIIPTIYETPSGYRNENTDESFICVKTLNSMTKTGLVMDRQQLQNSKVVEAIDVQDPNSTCEFKLVRLPSDMPIQTIHMCCQYSLLLNSKHKIVKICQLLKIIQGDPQLSKY